MTNLKKWLKNNPSVPFNGFGLESYTSGIDQGY